MEDGFKHYNQERIPVTIITGFLGSGKTTFLNHLIHKYPTTRFAIIENEFGELGVDPDILNREEQMPVYELLNGCICCTLNTDFYNSLQLIIENKTSIDHLLVETTGIADPSQVIDLFISNEQIQRNFIVNSVICLVDCSLIEGLLQSEKESVKQIALSDIVMLNKTDLLREKTTCHLKKIISDINPMAQVLETRYAHTNGTPVLATKAYSSSHIEETTLSYKALKISLNNIKRTQNDLVFHPAKLRHDIYSDGFIYRECTDPELFNIWITSFIYFNQNNLLRVKGILYVEGKDCRYIFQAVKGSVVFEKGSPWKADEDKISKIVIIGREIDRSGIEEKLDMFFAGKRNLNKANKTPNDSPKPVNI